MTGQMWRAIAAVRLLTLAYAAVVIVRHYREYAHPAGGLAVLAVMAAWTAVTIVAYRRPAPAARRRWRLVTADVTIAALLVLSTRLVDTHANVIGGRPTLPGPWAAAPVLACGVAGGPWAGVAGAIVIIAADFGERQSLRGGFGLSVLLLIAGGVAGYLVQLGERAEAAIGRAARAEAAAAERARIARGVHDSVLQVLALVSRRGREIGGPAAELGRLAGEQEAALRHLVTTEAQASAVAFGTDSRGPGVAGSGWLPGSRRSAAAGNAAGAQVDVRALLEPLGALSCPAGTVMLGEAKAQALAAAAGAAIDNVRLHAGPGAQAWVLLEDDGTSVTVSVRDDGSGFEPGRLAEAASAGRLGVSESIVGRIREIGGTASVTSAAGRGTEVELVVPR